MDIEGNLDAFVFINAGHDAARFAIEVLDAFDVWVAVRIPGTAVAITCSSRRRGELDAGENFSVPVRGTEPASGDGNRTLKCAGVADTVRSVVGGRHVFGAA